MSLKKKQDAKALVSHIRNIEADIRACADDVYTNKHCAELNIAIYDLVRACLYVLWAIGASRTNEFISLAKKLYSKRGQDALDKARLTAIDNLNAEDRAKKKEAM